MSDITAYLCCRDASRAIEFYKAAFGAKETMRLADGAGKVGHAELEIGDAIIMLADEHPELSFVSPLALNGTSVSLHLVVPNVYEVVASAVAAGATLERPVVNEFYGMRTGTIIDPFGHRWMVATQTEKLSNKEIEMRAAALYGAM